MNRTILIADDEKYTREGLKMALETSGYRILLAEDGKQALEIINSQEVDLLLTDFKMPHIDGMELMKKAQKINNSLLVIMITAHGSIESAVHAMKEGAFDYIAKPINLDEIEFVLNRAFNSQNLQQENSDLKKKLESKYTLGELTGISPQIEEIKRMIKQVAPSKSTILITGESGTGKELIANAIHFHSTRKNAPFIAVHCAALSENILESELFGHEKGAFTGAFEKKIGRFERADRGTLFLDEIAEISTKIQVKLLRVLQEMTFERVGGTIPVSVDVRILAATNTDLKTLIQSGGFREDLYYRLNVVTIPVPPLRNRKEDIQLLASQFLDYFNIENGKNIRGFTREASLLLMNYHWPGNIRELKNAIESMVVLSQGTQLDLIDLPYHIKNASLQEDKNNFDLNNSSILKTNEKHLIIDALKTTANNKTNAAKLLGISRRTLHRKLKRYKLDE
ncbi:sigma-54-dependent transcriptional regulator [Chlamydiota bacterium]